MNLAYFCAVVVIPGFAFSMLYYFRHLYYQWKKQTDPMEEFRDEDIAKYAIEV